LTGVTSNADMLVLRLLTHSTETSSQLNLVTDPISRFDIHWNIIIDNITAANLFMICLKI